jgi:hypothetical protein
MSAPSMMSSACEASALRARESRILVRDLQEIAQDGAALGEVIAEQNGGRSRVQLLDGRQPHQRGKFTQGDHAERQRGG